MKMILFASAMALSTVAVAQTTPAPTTNPDAAASPTTPDSAATPAPAAPDASMPPATPDASAPPASAPMTPDASAAPAAAPAGDTGAAPAAAATDDSSLPMCSKTVTDKCKQGGKGSGHGHKAMHHKKK